MITLDDLKSICPQGSVVGMETHLAALNAGMNEFQISENVEREAAFVAQVAHESGGFRYVRELASGAAYEGRIDLGNTQPGDGVRFKGRGLIQITGRANYALCGLALEADLITEPDLLAEPDLAARSAAWFWATHGCNELADAGNFKLITKRINGGVNGWADRVAYWDRAKEVFAA